MGQSFGADRYGSLQRNSTSQVQLNLSTSNDIRVAIGGQGYYGSSALLLNTGGTGIGGLDTGSLGVFQTWYVHLVLNGSVPGLVASLSKTAPTGFTSFVWTGWVFVTNQSSQVAITANSTTWDWISYGVAADFTGFGTPTSIEMQGMRIGSNWFVQCKFASGTSTAVEARIAIPFVSADTSRNPSLKIVGDAVISNAATVPFSVLIEPSVSYMTLSKSGTTNGLGKSNASSILGSGESLSLFATIPIQGWSNVL